VLERGFLGEFGSWELGFDGAQHWCGELHWERSLLKALEVLHIGISLSQVRTTSCSHGFRIGGTQEQLYEDDIPSSLSQISSSSHRTTTFPITLSQTKHSFNMSVPYLIATEVSFPSNIFNPMSANICTPQHVNRSTGIVTVSMRFCSVLEAANIFLNAANTTGVALPTNART
jgi:hypothetical protein